MLTEAIKCKNNNDLTDDKACNNIYTTTMLSASGWAGYKESQKSQFASLTPVCSPVATPSVASTAKRILRMSAFPLPRRDAFTFGQYNDPG
mmetsp:Transcript_5029/g.7109  ORF Transcript_5029/g.7109 Transcript_5029/m.7109 type:complete len:91 (+) Transcript_5029:125-397(+)